MEWRTFCQTGMDTECSSLHTVSSLTSVATVTMVPMKTTTLVGGCKDGNIHCIRLLLLVCS